jgi:hypothetical protein
MRGANSGQSTGRMEIIQDLTKGVVIHPITRVKTY